LLGASPAEAAEALETLADASLLASPAPGQYLLHPLARAFAADQAAPVPRLRPGTPIATASRKVGLLTALALNPNRSTSACR
jgi:hypothetical protein